MASERPSVLIGLLLAFRRHRGGRDSQGFTRIHVAGLAPVHDISVGDVDLNDCWRPFRRFLFKPIDLLRSQVHHVVGDEFVHLRPRCGYRLQNVTQF